MALEINKLTNGNIYVNETNLIGKFDEIQLPSVKPKMADHDPMGLVGVVSYASKMEKLEGKIKWNSFYKDVYAKFANPYKSLRVMFRSNMEKYVGADRASQVPYVVTMNINSMGVPGGNFKAGDNAEFETDFTATYMKIEENGVTVLEFDAVNNIYFVDGVDLLKEYRENIGQ